MERVKQFMGFPLLATLLWLLYILGNQRGHDAVIWASAFLLCLALGCWIYEHLLRGRFPLSTPLVSLALIALVFLTRQRSFSGDSLAIDSPGEDGSSLRRHCLEAVFPAGTRRLARSRQTCFVDFTADWCISCKFNERTAIDVPAVRQAFASNGIVPMKADWTNANPEITALSRIWTRRRAILCSLSWGRIPRTDCAPRDSHAKYCSRRARQSEPLAVGCNLRESPAWILLSHENLNQPSGRRADGVRTRQTSSRCTGARLHLEGHLWGKSASFQISKANLWCLSGLISDVPSSRSTMARKTCNSSKRNSWTRVLSGFDLFFGARQQGNESPDAARAVSGSLAPRTAYLAMKKAR